MQQALAATVVTASHLRLREDAAALRDAHHFAGSGGGRVDPGPAGRLYRLVRDLARRPTRLAGEALDRLAAELGHSRSGSWLDAGSEHASPIMAAAAVAESVAAMGSMTREGEVLAWLAADLVLADRLGWPAPVPLLATAIVHPAFAPCQDGRRARPGEPAWDTVSNLAYARAAIAAYGSARDAAGRSTRLIAASARSRTHGVEAAIFALLDDDAVAATGLAALPGLGSERAARRLLERLVAQDGLRELTGRATFRLYGL